MNKLLSACYAEYIKARKSKVFPVTIIAFSLAPIMGSLFVIVLRSRELLANNKILEEKFDKLFGIRTEVYKLIEEKRKNKEISSSTEAKVILSAEGKDLEILNSSMNFLNTLFIVSEIEIVEGNPEIKIEKSQNQKCERCWQLKPSVGKTPEHPALCDRCANAVS